MEPQVAAAVDPMATGGHVTAHDAVVLTKRPLPRHFPILSLRGLESSIDKKYLMQILDEIVPGKVIAVQVVREDDECFAFIQFDDLKSAQLVLENGHWMPSHDALRLLKSPYKEGHRDKHPKNHHNLLPDIHISKTLLLHMWWGIPSVERITVKHIKHGTCAKIYGNVIVFDNQNQQMLYRRGPCKSDEARSGDDLKLKGPHCSALDARVGATIGINLFEDRGDGIERVFARGRIYTQGDGYFEEDVEGDGGVVSVVYASVPDAVWARVCVSGLQNMRVCGCIKARREIDGVQSEFVMFTKSSDNRVDVGPDGFFRLDRSVVVASKRAGLTISVSLNLCNADGKRCVVQKDLVFDAVFKMEDQTIQDDAFGGKVTVSLAYKDMPGLHFDAKDPYDDDDESSVGGPGYDDTMEVIDKQLMDAFNEQMALRCKS